MKKVTYCLIISIILVLCSNVILAAENASFGIGLTSTKTSVNPGDEIVVTTKVKDFKNMTEGIYSFLATIEYDKEFFEPLTESSVKGLGTWSSLPTFNPDNGLITADSGSGVKQESDVFAITFKVKDTVQNGTSTQIVVKDFEASEGDSDISADAEARLTINVAEKVNDDATDEGNNDEDNNDNNGNNGGNDNNDNNNDNNDNNNNGNDENNTGNNNNDNNNDNNDDKNNNNGNNSNNNNGTKDDATTSKDEKLPQTGENMWMVITLILVVCAIGIVSYKSYKKYGNI